MNRTLAMLSSGLVLFIAPVAQGIAPVAEGAQSSALIAHESAPVAQDSSAKTPSVRFQRSAWKSGDTVTSSVNLEGTLTVTMSIRGEVAQRFDQSNHEVMRKKSVVLAAKDGSRSKVSVHYDEMVETAQSGDDDESKPDAPSPLTGKTFVLEQSSKGVTIADEDGTVVGDEVAVLVREKELSRDGSLERGFDRLAELVSESPRKIGDKISVPEEVALELAGGDEDIKDARMTLRLVESREIDGSPCAVFEAEIRLAGKAASGEYSVAIELDGEVAFHIASSRFASAELSGRVTIDGSVSTEDATVAISGEGPLKIVESATYGREDR